MHFISIYRPTTTLKFDFKIIRLIDYHFSIQINISVLLVMRERVYSPDKVCINTQAGTLLLNLSYILSNITRS